MHSTEQQSFDQVAHEAEPIGDQSDAKQASSANSTEPTLPRRQWPRMWVICCGVLLALAAGRAFLEEEIGKAKKADRVELALSELDQLKAKANNGDGAAACLLGGRYEKGDRVPKDASEAMRWYAIGVRAGNVDAEFKLAGCMFDEPKDLPYEVRERNAKPHLLAAAEHGHAHAQALLGLGYLEGILGETKNTQQAVKWLRLSADQGFNGAQNLLANCYADGVGVAKDEDVAATLYRKAADQGFPLAQFSLGMCYAKGKGVVKDDAEAVNWYRMAAYQGDVSAQITLAQCYAEGQGVPIILWEAAKWYRKAAVQGDALAQLKIGIAYSKGEGWPKDEVEAVEWYRKAAVQGLALAQKNLAQSYAEGKGVAKDDLEAIKWYRAAADQGDASAQCYLGYAYAQGWSVIQDGTESVKWYRMAAEQGELKAQLELASIYSYGKSVAKDDQEATRWWRKAADQGDATAQFQVGWAYANGAGVAKDSAESARWFRKAAEQGGAGAQFNLGVFYSKGMGVNKDDAESARWFRKAADQGLARAQSQLGSAYAKGRGVGKDDAEAVNWYRKAAIQGDVWSQRRLGDAYAFGIGVPKDEAEGAVWFHKAADQGDLESQDRLGLCYAKGTGVSKDLVEAVKWFKKAAEQGFARAECNLGRSYYEGEGVAKNLVEAYKWWNLAAGQGAQYAKQYLPVVQREMTPSQVAEAQKLSLAFKPRKAPDAANVTLAQIAESRPSGIGTGVLITEDGYVVTCAHVVREASQFRVRTTQGLLPATLVKTDTSADLALLKVEGHFSPLPIVPSREVKLGDTVLTVGFPNPDLQGYSPKLARGESASLAGTKDDPRYFQISVAVQPGNSGGPLVDSRGNVVGVVSSKLSQRAALESTGGILAENVNYAVKSSYLLSLLESLPEVSAKLIQATTEESKPSEVIEATQKAAVLVLVY